MKFFETSAKTGTGITEAFEYIARDIIKSMQEKKDKQTVIDGQMKVDMSVPDLNSRGG